MADITRPTLESVRDLLTQIPYPGFKRDIVSFGTVQDVALEGCHIRIRLDLRTDNPELPKQVSRDIVAKLKDTFPKYVVQVELAEPAPASGPAPGQSGQSMFGQKGIPGIRHTIAVGSGKGGVGKSTVSVNLAAALVTDGHRVGLLDADVYGPSLPTMLGTRERPKVTSRETLLPIEKNGLKLMSIGFLTGKDDPVIWRGLMVMKMIKQFLAGIEWGELDFLVIDLPPGTGDTQLTLVQEIRLSGALIVTTPQDLALMDAARAANMFRKVQVPILGLVENMSHYICPQCGHRDEIFGSGGADKESRRLDVPLVGRIPLVGCIREDGDSGNPTVFDRPDSPESLVFFDIARHVAKAAEAQSTETPELRIS